MQTGTAAVRFVVALPHTVFDPDQAFEEITARPRTDGGERRPDRRDAPLRPDAADGAGWESNEFRAVVPDVVAQTRGSRAGLIERDDLAWESMS
ncbi:hypothetical protein [Pseudonocardia sp. NPDC049154]|uniref:hypothetical protein n=1 Tax=Pseudonocardia sp. NPDC049154 TaxID=3155501 RepID=UPI0033CBA73F